MHAALLHGLWSWGRAVLKNKKHNRYLTMTIPKVKSIIASTSWTNRRGMPVRGRGRYKGTKLLQLFLGSDWSARRWNLQGREEKWGLRHNHLLETFLFRTSTCSTVKFIYHICPAKECADNICYSTVPGKERGSSQLIMLSRATSFSLYPNLLYTRTCTVPGRLLRQREGNLFLALLR
jgi:hypothetical protein